MMKPLKLNWLLNDNLATVIECVKCLGRPRRRNRDESMIADFLKHLFPRVVPERNLRFSYTFCLGGLAFTAFLIMLGSGMLLLVYYQPTPERAFNSVLFL